MSDAVSAPWLMAAPVVLPLAAGLISVVLPRGRAELAVGVGALILIASSALLQTVTASGTQFMAVGGWTPPLGIGWRLDFIAALFLTVTALICLVVALFARGYLRRALPAVDERFWPPFLLLWAALAALYLSADLFNLYVALELLTLAAVMLVTLEGNGAALTGAMRYLLVALAGSAAYLLGVAFLYQGAGTLDLAQAAAGGAVPALAVALMTAGLMAKGALFPLHGWLPPAHAAAPAPGSALLSGLVVKGAFYVLLRLWFEAEPIAGTTRQILGLLGVLAIGWGALLALRQARLKLVVAYSTVAQLGYLLLIFPLAEGAWRTAALSGGLYLALSHSMAKGAMFLSAGLVLYAAGHDRIAELRGLASRAPMTLFAFALAGVTLMGLPPSGGFIAKWQLLTAALGGGQWPWAVVLLAGSLLTAGYTFRAVASTFGSAPAQRDFRTPPRSLEWLALGLALAALGIGFLAADWLPRLEAAFR